MADPRSCLGASSANGDPQAPLVDGGLQAHFIRTFRATFGETPHRYLQRRRVERAMALLRNTELSVTDICFAVGFSSLGMLVPAAVSALVNIY